MAIDKAVKSYIVDMGDAATIHHDGEKTFVFVVEKIDEEYMVTDSRIPRDGSYYEKDMKNMFPLSVRYDMEQMQLDGSIEKMILEVEEKASLYFHN